MKKFFRSKLVRAIFILLVIIIAGVVWLASQLPKAGPARIPLNSKCVGIHAKASYAWIIYTDNGAILIDAGMDENGTAIIAELKSQGLKPEDVHTILLTHGHLDHWVGAKAFPQAQIMAGPGESPRIRGEQKSHGWLTRIFETISPETTPPPNLQELKGDENLTIDGETIQVVHLPGHTTGCVAFIWEDVLFIGDVFVAKGDGITLSPSFFCDDVAMNRESLKKLLPLKFTRAADGHTGIIENVHEKLEAFLAE